MKYIKESFIAASLIGLFIYFDRKYFKNSAKKESKAKVPIRTTTDELIMKAKESGNIYTKKGWNDLRNNMMKNISPNFVPISYEEAEERGDFKRAFNER